METLRSIPHSPTRTVLHLKEVRLAGEKKGKKSNIKILNLSLSLKLITLLGAGVWGVALRISKLINEADDTTFLISGIIPNFSDNISCL
jgi:hypothetical protein